MLLFVVIIATAHLVKDIIFTGWQSGVSKMYDGRFPRA